jgi:HPt (histidine-containing phosphotransfer) domain-containing protein
MKKQCQLFNPPNLLQAKIPRTGGPRMDEITADAEAALREIKDTYETVVKEDLRKIDEAIARAMETPSAAADALKEIFAVSHDIKGQAASFDYPLLTAIAQSLCSFISANEAAAIRELDVVGAHARAMGTVVAHSIRGDGLEKGRKLLDVLAAAVEQALARK